MSDLSTYLEKEIVNCNVKISEKNNTLRSIEEEIRTLESIISNYRATIEEINGSVTSLNNDIYQLNELKKYI